MTLQQVAYLVSLTQGEPIPCPEMAPISKLDMAVYLVETSIKHKMIAKKLTEWINLQDCRWHSKRHH